MAWKNRCQKSKNGGLKKQDIGAKKQTFWCEKSK